MIRKKQSIITSIAIANKNGKLYTNQRVKDNDLILELYQEGKIIYVQSFKHGQGLLVPKYATLLEY